MRVLGREDLAFIGPEVRAVTTRLGRVYIRELTAAQALELGRLPDGDEATYRLVGYSVCDEDGHPLWPELEPGTGEDILDAVGAMPRRLVEAITQAALELNGLTTPPEDLAGN